MTAEEYISRYGGFCSGCADHGTVCPNSGLPCNSDARKQAIKHVLRAYKYGVWNGHIPSQHLERNT